MLVIERDDNDDNHHNNDDHDDGANDHHHNDGTPSTTLPQEAPAFPEYRIAERIVAPETGDTVVLLLDPASYTSLSDLDLYDVIADAVDRFPPILVAHVVDSPEAASAVLLEQPDEDQELLLADHYLARLEDGFRIVYLGPFEDSGTAVLGS